VPEPRLVAAAHGTRSAVGLATLAALADRIRAARPGVDVVLCYLDVLEPSLAVTLAAWHEPTVVVPMLLSTGYHVTQDIPHIVAGRPDVRVAGRLGPHPLLTTALVDRLADAPGGDAAQVALVASGSRHPAAADDLTTAADDLARGLQRPVAPVTLDANPTARLADLDRAGIVAVATYLLAEGFFADEVRRVAAGRPVTAPIGAHPAVVDLIWRRYDEAAAG
jgi:sirohydrochlorin ferrochelatase